MTQNVGEEGACCTQSEAEHQQGDDAGGVEQSDEHGSDANNDHGDLGDIHDLLVGGIGLQNGTVDVVGEDGAGAQQVGVGGGHGCGDDTGKQQTADQRGHCAHCQDGQSVTCADISELSSVEDAHVHQSQDDDAQDSGDESKDEVDDCCQDGALLCSLAVTGGIVTGDSLLTNGEGCQVHDGQTDDVHQVVAGEQLEGLLGNVGDNVLPAASHVGGEGNGDDHADDDQEDLDEVGQGDGPQTAHDGVDGDDNSDNDDSDLVADAQHGGQDDGGGDELTGSQTNQRQQHDDGGDQACALAVAAAEVLGNGLDGGFTELGCQEGQDDECQTHGNDVPGGTDAIAGHTVLDNAQGGAATDLGSSQGTCHQQGAEAAACDHEVGVGGDAGGRVPADEQHGQHVHRNNDRNSQIELHSFFSFFIIFC